jgi:HK97 family phage major capsid protein
MWARSRPNAVWLINQDVEVDLLKMTMPGDVTSGALVPVYLPAGGASQLPYAQLFGRPVIPVEYCQTMGTAGDVIFADFSQYVFIDKGSPETASSIHLRFDYGETALRFVFRCDGQPKWNAALTPFKGSSTVSPFIVTATA